MADNLNGLFSSETGAFVYGEAVRAVRDFSMEEKLSGGVLVGLSGGADSVMLLRFLLKYRSYAEDFPILAVHINHMIRAGEAERDEAFSRSLCGELGVEFKALRIDVPAYAKECGKSIEEAARFARYQTFSEIIQGRDDINTIAIAHNADDNFETVIINMMRGAGTLGMSGINPKRENIVRPLIYLKKSDIVKALFEENANFVTDSTNESDDYTRNYIRHNILPPIASAFPEASGAVLKMCKNLREDEECLSSLAADFVRKYENGKIPRAELSVLPSALLFRVLKIYFSDVCARSLERVHIEQIKACLTGAADFSVSVPSGLDFVSLDGLCGFSYNIKANMTLPFMYNITAPAVDIPEFSAKIELANEFANDGSSKVYNISTQANLSSAIIKGELYIRSKNDGDAYFYGGITHKLKKLFNDRKIPVAARADIPVLCDRDGIVWVPGFGVRDDGGMGSLKIRISVNNNSKRHFYLPSKTKKKGEEPKCGCQGNTITDGSLERLLNEG